jgi:hypothetical protein
MELQLANKVQHHIADLLWKAKNTSEVKEIIGTYGKDAVVVYNMMLAAYYDNVDSVDLVQPILERIKNGT